MEVQRKTVPVKKASKKRFSEIHSRLYFNRKFFGAAFGRLLDLQRTCTKTC